MFGEKTKFLKNALLDPTPQLPLRRRPRGATSRFGPLVDISCRVQRLVYDGGDPGAPWSYPELRSGRTARKYHTGARITLRCPWIEAGAIPCL